MTKLTDMTPEQIEAHMEYVNSGRAAEDWEKYHNKLEAVLALVTPEIAAERELQEVVWVGDVIRFRENVKVSNLIEAEWVDPSREVEQWMVEQFAVLTQEGEKGNAIVRWLVENGPADLNKIMAQGILEMHGRGFSQKDHEQFAMLHGYSVSAGGGLSYFSPAMCQRADEAVDKLMQEMKEL
jgi:hypothetical protein